MTNKDFSLFPSPCYIMEEGLLRKNLALIKSVADRAGVEIILAFKSFAMWRSFPIFREYIDHSTASSVYEARLALEEFTVSDERTAKVINARLKELGREPVWKDWDASFDFFGNIANG